ncbi:SPOR domain-containing protein [Parashewanella spongiae]|nr:SPOR domain-containing protein [Parashewanella spongiae]
MPLESFKNAANVNTLVKKLRKAGFPAYTLPKVSVDKQLTKVFVGTRGC